MRRRRGENRQKKKEKELKRQEELRKEREATPEWFWEEARHAETLDNDGLLESITSIDRYLETIAIECHNAEASANETQSHIVDNESERRSILDAEQAREFLPKKLWRRYCDAYWFVFQAPPITLSREAEHRVRELEIIQTELKRRFASCRVALQHIRDRQRLFERLRDILRSLHSRRREAERTRRRQEREETKRDREEQSKARHDRTVAAAAAYHDKTRKRAGSLRKSLLDQLTLYPNCPYCNGPLANPRADHIYPVVKGV
jgi:hypothetical protein